MTMTVDVQSTRARAKAALTLAVITPVLTELFSANMGPAEVLHPIGFLLQFLAYGVPVLLIRELAVRARVGLPGLFLMGLAYSIFNEGIIAKTLFFGPPGGGMTDYDTFFLGEIHVVWMVFITTWHALHAVVFPIALVSALFPEVREESWLSVPVRLAFLVVWVPAGVLGFLKFNAQYADWGYFTAFVATIVGLLLLGAKLPGRAPFFADGRPGTVWQVCLGVAFYPVLVVTPFVAVEVGAPFAILVVWPWGFASLFYLWLRRRRWDTYRPLAFIALGNYGSGSFLNMVFQLGADPRRVDKIATLAVLTALFAIIALWAVLRKKGQRVAPAAGSDG